MKLLDLQTYYKTVMLISVVMLVLAVGCKGSGGGPAGGIGRRSIDPSLVPSTSVTINNVQVISNVVYISGHNLDRVESLRITSANGLDKKLFIDSKTVGTLQAFVDTLPSLTIVSDTIYDFVLSTAHGATIIPLVFETNANSITSAKIVDGAVTNSKIATGAVTGSKIATGTIALDKIADVGAGDGYVIKWDDVAAQWVAAPDDAGAGGGGTVTSVMRGNGIQGSGTALTTSGTIAVNTGTGPGQVPQLDAFGDFIFPNVLQLTGTGLISLLNGAREFRIFNDGAFRVHEMTVGDHLIIDAGGNTTISQDLIVSGQLNAGGLIYPTSDGGAGNVLITNGAGVLSWTAGNSGTVTSVATGSGLLGGTITTTGTLSVDVGTTAGKILQLNGSAQLPAVDGSLLTNLSSTQLNSNISTTEFGYLDGVTSAIQTQLNSKEASFGSGSSGQYLDGDKTWQTLDTLAVIENTNLYFTVARAKSAAVSDAIGNGILDVAPSQNAVFDALALKADSSSLGNYVLKTGDTISGNLLLQSSLRIEDAGAGTNYVAIQAPILGANYTLTLPSDDGTSGQLLKTDGAGILSWVSGATPTGSAGGDLSGSYPNPEIAAGVIVDADISSSANIDATKLGTGAVTNTEFNYLDGVTSAIQTQFAAKEPSIGTGDSSTYWRGDKTWQTLGSMGLQNSDAVAISGGSINGTTIGGTTPAAVRGTSLTASSSLVLEDPGVGVFDVTVQSPIGLAAAYILTLPGDDGASGQFLRTDGAGVLSWVTPTSGTVTNVATGSGLTGGAITTTGTISIASGGVTSIHLSDGAIADADVNASANITATKLGTGVVDNTELNYLDGVTSAIQTQFSGKEPSIGTGATTTYWRGDKTWQTLDTAVKAAAVADSISDAVTDVAPSQNAVFDALALKVAKNGDTMSGTLTAPSFAAKTSITVEDPGAGLFTAIIQAPTLAASYVLTLPVDDGTDGQFLKTDGSGNLAWITAAGSGTVTNIATGSGLTGGAITTTGTISISSGGVTTTHLLDGTIADADVNASANITATKLGTGVVDNTEFNYLDGVTSSIQTQLSNKQPLDADLTAIGGLAHGTNNFMVSDGANWTSIGSGAARTSLGLGTMATQNANAVAISGGTATLTTSTLKTSLIVEDPGAGTFTATVQSPTLTASYGLTLPTGLPGTSGYALTSDTSGNLSWASSVTDLTAGSAITISGTGNITVNHADTSAQASIDNANGTVIQDITLDTYGHATGITSLDLDGRYFTETEANTNFVNASGDTMSGALTVAAGSAYIYANATTGGWGGLWLQNTGIDKWYILNDGAAGNHLNIYNYTAGSNALLINGTTNQATFYAQTNFGSGLSSTGTVTVTNGTVDIKNNDNTARTLRLFEASTSGSNYIGLKANAGLAADYTVTFPAAAPTTGAVLQSTNASGDMDWTTLVSAITAGTSITISGGTGNVTVNHADTSSVADITSPGTGNVLSGITFDTNGHVLTMTQYNLDDRYYTETEAGTNFVNASGDTMSGDLTVDGAIYGKLTDSGATPKIAYGYNAVAGGWGAIAMGYAPSATGVSAVALGQSVTASGYSSVALGMSSTASFDYSVAIGSGATTTAEGQIALGGAGTSVTTSGALTVNNGPMSIKNSDNTARELRLYENSDNGTDYIGLKSTASVGAAFALIFPSSLPTVSSSALTSDTSGNLSWNTLVSGISAGTGIVISGSTGNVTVSHDNTSDQVSVDNANGTVIQDIALDTLGHTTSITSLDLDSRYYTETEANTNYVNVSGDTMTGDLTVQGRIYPGYKGIVGGGGGGADLSTVWLMGASWPGSPGSGGSYANFYGMGFCHTNNANCPATNGVNGYQFDIVSNGTSNIQLGLDGKAYFAATVTLGGELVCTDCVDTAEIQDGAVAFADLNADAKSVVATGGAGSNYDLPTSWTNVSSLAITHNHAGKIVVTASGYTRRYERACVIGIGIGTTSTTVNDAQSDTDLSIMAPSGKGAVNAYATGQTPSTSNCGGTAITAGYEFTPAFDLLVSGFYGHYGYYYQIWHDTTQTKMIQQYTGYDDATWRSYYLQNPVYLRAGEKYIITRYAANGWTWEYDSPAEVNEYGDNGTVQNIWTLGNGRHNGCGNGNSFPNITDASYTYLGFGIVYSMATNTARYLYRPWSQTNTYSVSGSATETYYLNGNSTTITEATVGTQGDCGIIVNDITAVFVPE